MGKPKMIFSDPIAVPVIEKVLTESGNKVEIVTFGEVDGYRPFSDFVIHTGTEESFE